MATNYFSDYKKGKFGATHAHTKMLHSFTDYFNSGEFTKTMKSYVPTSRENASENIVNAVGAGANAVNIMGIGAAAATIAAGGVSAAGFVAGMCGPQAAVTLGVVGLALMVKSAYSSRESAHETLTDYCWSFTDDEKPLHNIDERAADAAMYLLKEGYHHYKLLAQKNEAARIKFHAWLEAYLRSIQSFGMLVDSLAANYEYVLPPQLEKDKNKKTAFYALLKQIDLKRKEIEKAEPSNTKTDHPVFLYMRRLQHTANYLQAPYIVNEYQMHKFLGGQMRELPDPFAHHFESFRNLHTKNVGLAIQGFEVHAKKLDEILKKFRTRGMLK